MLTHPITDYLTVSSFGEDLIIYGFLFGFSGFLRLQTERQRDALSKLELEKRLSETQLKALQMQMEPHFLFNTLNAIISLMTQEKHSQAMTTLSHLNTILRRTLERRAPDNGCGPSDAAPKGYGIGIQNTRERLAYFYPGQHAFLAGARAAGGYEVTIEIPYERAKA